MFCCHLKSDYTSTFAGSQQVAALGAVSPPEGTAGFHRRKVRDTGGSCLTIRQAMCLTIRLADDVGPTGEQILLNHGASAVKGGVRSRLHRAFTCLNKLVCAFLRRL